LTTLESFSKLFLTLITFIENIFLDSGTLKLVTEHKQFPNFIWLVLRTHSNRNSRKLILLWKTLDQTL